MAGPGRNALPERVDGASGARIEERLRTARRGRHSGGVILACALFAVGCVPPQVPSQTVSEVARRLNVAARFGRMDVALEHTAPDERDAFAERHATWGHDLRVVDVELGRLKMESTESARVFVDVSWMRMDEGLLRTTRVEQVWENPGGGWVLTRESRHAGDRGLLDRAVVVLRPERAPDVHLPSKTIR